MSAKKIAIIIHAGAGKYPKDLIRAKKIQEKISEIAHEGYAYLRTHSAVDTVVKVVQWLEDWPETNAGIGSLLQSDGKARLSASLMDGHLKRFSGVINIEKIKNPILVAKLLQKEKDRVLSGEGAQKFALEKGLKSFDPRTKESIKKWGLMSQKNEKYGTVGACALDINGRLAAATSTGGRGMERIGRVSDSATPAGNYADDYAACSATGIGEDILDVSLCSRLADRGKEYKDLGISFNRVFKEMASQKRQLASIGVDQKGQVFSKNTTEILYYSSLTPYKSETFKIN